jgi:TetR/AcrR family transcriptional regulator
MELKIETEEKILQAAKSVFQQKGFDGCRMQDIADEAGINKALLHYYFRSKDRLFDAVFKDAFRKFFPKVQEIMASDITLDKKLESFIDKYIDLLVDNPMLPIFILNEINRNPEKIAEIINLNVINPNLLFGSIMKEIELKSIRKTDPRHLIISIIGMCVFPFVGKPIIKNFLMNNSEEEFNLFIGQRKKEITELVLKSLTNTK